MKRFAIQVRFDAAMYAIISQIAKSEGKTLSAWIRELVIKELESKTPVQIL